MSAFYQRQLEREAPKGPQFTFPEYVAHHNAEKANSFLVGEGMQPSKSASELAARLGHYINKNGDAGLKSVMQLHPDREEIMNTITAADHRPGFHNFTGNWGGTPYIQPVSQFNNCGGCSGGSFSNCGGCSGGCGGAKYSNASGGSAPTGNTERTLNALAVVAIVGILFLAAIRNS